MTTATSETPRSGYLRCHLPLSKNRGFDVTYVRIFTDVDDKSFNRANKEGVLEEIAETYIRGTPDTQALGIQSPTHEPLATDNTRYAKNHFTLVEKGLAFEWTGCLFSVSSFPDTENIEKKSG
jgi:cysteinyl-tRNA synthetase